MFTCVNVTIHMFMISVNENEIIKHPSEEQQNVTRKVDFLKTQRRAKPLGGVLKIAVVHLHAKSSINTSSFTNSITYNFQFISIIYSIFSNKQPGHLFQN